IYCLEMADAAELLFLESVLRNGDGTSDSFAAALNLIRKYQGIERTMARAEGFTRAARRIVAEFPVSPIQRALLALTEAVVGRDH
ncbi:MAG: polyprenyl synthetase family protein, partial [Bryobacteraceae bacterium]|nr:polyprenyl synthetase family protein [Bryobacteraceae bacterium]